MQAVRRRLSLTNRTALAVSALQNSSPTGRSNEEVPVFNGMNVVYAATYLKYLERRRREKAQEEQAAAQAAQLQSIRAAEEDRKKSATSVVAAVRAHQKQKARAERRRRAKKRLNQTNSS